MIPMTRLIYITHPSVEIDRDKLPHEWSLSDKGRQEMAGLLVLPLLSDAQIIYSSTEPKASEVAQAIAERYHLPFTQEKDLGEADRTATPFLPLEEYMAAIQECYTAPDKSVRGWETHRHMLERNAAVLEKIKREHAGQTIIIVGHGGAGTVMKCYIKGIEPDFAEDPKQTGCYFLADLDQSEILQDWVKY